MVKLFVWVEKLSQGFCRVKAMSQCEKAFHRMNSYFTGRKAIS